jgi:hypothetical protein
MRRRRGAQGYCICTEPLTVALTPDLPASTGNGGAAAAMSADAALKRGSGGAKASPVWTSTARNVTVLKPKALA